MTLHLGIDVGTQSLKAVVLEAEGRVRGHGASGYSFSVPAPLHAEQSPHLWLAALRPAITEAITRTGVTAADIASLAIAGQLDGCVPVDEQGAPLSPALIWMDRRARADLEDVPAALIRERTDVTVDASHMGAKIRWFKRNLATTQRIARFHQPTTFLVERLTGEACIDPSLASTTMLFDASAQTFASDLLAAFNVRAAELPRVQPAWSRAGALTVSGAECTGLNPGTVVAVGTGDDFASVLGAGVIDPGTLVGNLGTAEVTATLIAHRTRDPRGLLQTHPFVNEGYLIGHPGWLSGGARHWFKRLAQIGMDEDFDVLAEAAPVGAGGVQFLPALAGAVTPEWIAGARGCFYGLSTSHDRSHLARAVLEGCAFAMRDVGERLQALDIPIERVLLTGGGARSRLWAQIRADVIGRPVLYGLERDTSALGAAILAAAAYHGPAIIRGLAESLAPPAARAEPRPSAAAIYERGYRRYRQLFEALRPLYDDPNDD